jgi:hypothetical protein
MIQAYIRHVLASTQAASLFPCGCSTYAVDFVAATYRVPGCGHKPSVLKFQEQCGLVRRECLMPRVGVLDHPRQFWVCQATVDAASNSCEVLSLSVSNALHFYLDQAWVGYSTHFTGLTPAPAAGSDSVL